MAKCSEAESSEQLLAFNWRPFDLNASFRSGDPMRLQFTQTLNLCELYVPDMENVTLAQSAPGALTNKNLGQSVNQFTNRLMRC